MNEDASIPEMLLSILKFFAHESCGQCTPCRVGTHQLLDLADHFRQGQGSEADLERMINVSKAMVATSLCPLGQSLIMPVKSAVENFRGDFLKNGNPAGKTPG
jgi:NADH:ubiquinone oxidoreductase subunit F (NADH-binding)